MEEYTTTYLTSVPVYLSRVNIPFYHPLKDVIFFYYTEQNNLKTLTNLFNNDIITK